MIYSLKSEISIHTDEVADFAKWGGYKAQNDGKKLENKLKGKS